MSEQVSKNNVREVALLALERIESDQSFTDLVLSQLLEKGGLSNKDRRLVSQIVRGVVRMKLQLDWLLSHFLKNPNVPHRFRWIMWMALYQIKFLDKVPDFAVVNEAVNLTKRHVGLKWAKVANGILRSYLRTAAGIQYPSLEREPVKAIAVMTSHPPWLVQRLIKQMGSGQALKFCHSNNLAPGVTVRLNSLASLESDFESALTNVGLEATKLALANYYRLARFPKTLQKEWLNSGKITVQDLSAGLVGYLVAPRPGELLFDICAAPGGKARHLAELAGPGATIIAADKSPVRVSLMKKQIRTPGPLFPLVADATHFPARGADKVLLDVPCSGFGVLQKKPDIRWRRSPEGLLQLTLLQGRLLRAAADLVRPGGQLIYSTCTVLTEENEEIVQTFLKDHPEFTLEKLSEQGFLAPFVSNNYYIRTWPHKHGTDGSFAVKITKTGKN